MMFERLDVEAQRAVDTAIAEAHRFGHGWLGTEHILVSLLDDRAPLPEPVQALLPDADAVRERLASGLRGGGSRVSDDLLLASLGIDVAEVRRRAAETFGPDAVQQASRRARFRRGQRRRRRCERPPHCMTVLPGESLAMAPKLKRAFERARQRCDHRNQPTISPSVLLAALLSIEDGLASELLVLMGVDVKQVRRLLDT